jgi:hypothetical protein
MGGKASQYIIRHVTGRRRRVRAKLLAASVLAVVAALAGCASLVPRQYEYDEQIDLSLDGSAAVYVNGSVPALVALRGIPLDTRPSARFDRAAITRFFTSPGVRVSRVGTSRRHNRRFVHIRLIVDDLQRLEESPALMWEHVRLERVDGEFVYTEVVGPPSGPPVEGVGWTGDELVAFRLHLPSRIRYHNAPSKQVERGNILDWEQSLSDRLKGVPVRMEARMDPESILYSTLVLFGLMALLVAVTLAGILWWLMRKGRKQAT